MRLFYQTLFFFFFVGVSNAQDTLLYENFQSNDLGQFTTEDLDGLMLNPDFSQLGPAFSVVPIAGPNDYRAIGVSSFTNGSTADNWLISPQIQINNPNTILSWEANSLSGDTDQLEAYTVMISTTSNMVSAFTGQLLRINIESDTKTLRSVDLSAYVGQAIYIAFNQFTTDGYALALDNISVIQPTEGPAAQLVELQGERYQDISTLNLSLNIFNPGSQIIETMTVEGSINGAFGDFDFQDLSIEPQQNGLVDFSGLFPFEADRYEIEARIISVNGQEMDGDFITKTVYVIEDAPKQTLVFEEATSTSCGWCPLGAVHKEIMKVKYNQEVITISVHDDDPMANVVYALGLNNQEDFGGYPSATLNRESFTNPEDVEAYFVNEFKASAPLSISLQQNYDTESRFLEVNLNGIAHTTLGGDNHRFSLAIIEDNVRGIDATYDQSNNFSFEALNQPLVGIDGIDWQQRPDPVPAQQMEYDDVARDLVGGFDGIVNSMNSVSFGEELSHDLSYIIPSTFNEEELWLVAMAIDVETGQIVNAIKEKLKVGTNVKDLSSGLSFNLSPNPATKVVDLNINLDLGKKVEVSFWNAQGSLIKLNEYDLLAGENRLALDRGQLESGVYYCRLVSDGKVYTRKFIFI